MRSCNNLRIWERKAKEKLEEAMKNIKYGRD